MVDATIQHLHACLGEEERINVGKQEIPAIGTQHNNYISRRFDSVYTILAAISSEPLAGTRNVFSTFPSYSNDR